MNLYEFINNCGITGTDYLGMILDALAQQEMAFDFVGSPQYRYIAIGKERLSRNIAETQVYMHIKSHSCATGESMDSETVDVATAEPRTPMNGNEFPTGIYLPLIHRQAGHAKFVQKGTIGIAAIKVTFFETELHGDIDWEYPQRGGRQWNINYANNDDYNGTGVKGGRTDLWDFKPGRVSEAGDAPVRTYGVTIHVRWCYCNNKVEFHLRAQNRINNTPNNTPDPQFSYLDVGTLSRTAAGGGVRESPVPEGTYSTSEDRGWTVVDQYVDSPAE